MPVTLSILVPVHGEDKGEVTVPETLEAGGEKLVLNGAGVRTKLGFEIYVGALYLRERCHEADSVIAGDEPMAIRLQIISGMVTPQNMEAAIRDGFEKSAGESTGAIAEEMDAFVSIFADEITPGDVFELKYVPGNGIEACKNGALVSVTPGLPFKTALFGIWLSADPVQRALKDGMLGEG